MEIIDSLRIIIESNIEEDEGVKKIIYKQFKGYVTLLILYVVYDDVCGYVIYLFVFSLLDLKYPVSMYNLHILKIILD